MDRAALDAALKHGIPCGGWCPRGRRAEDGSISERYPLIETPSREYSQRTEWNVRDSDGTLILFDPPMRGGTLLTKDCAKQLNKPVMSMELTGDLPIAAMLDWLDNWAISVLNVGGPRGSAGPRIYQDAFRLLDELFATIR